MKTRTVVSILLGCYVVYSCGTSKSKDTSKSNLKQELVEKNRGTVSLLDRIIQLPGVVLRNGNPIINKTANSINANATEEPLYILNSYIVGSSFRAVNALVDSFNVKKIKVLSSVEAAEYGSRAANGVIRITTYQ